MENKFLQVEVDGEGRTIRVLDKRTRMSWKGFSLLQTVYEDGYRCPVNISLAKEAGWEIRSCEKNDTMEIDYSHPKLKLALGLVIELQGDKIKISIPASRIKEGKSVSWTKGKPNRLMKIELLPQFGAAAEGDDGYLVLPQQSGVLCEFKDKISSEYEIGIYSKSFVECNMPVFGLKNGNSSLLGIIEGGKYDASLKLGTNYGENHLYYIHPSFCLRDYYDEEKLPEDISVEYHFAAGNGASYVGMAKTYRNYLLANGNVKPLKERVKDNPVLDYASKCLEVRIRNGWKPAPPEILEQTPENEPEMHVACTFERAGDIINEFKRQGIDNTEFCLVGWNIGGHDGRFPQLFPVEKRLGGEKKLKELINETQYLGFQITAHDCYHDFYSISENYNEDFLLKTHNGTVCKYAKMSGGQAYLACARMAYELFAKSNFPQIRELGFKGLHFSDVLSIIGLYKCYDSRHPLTKRECGEWRNKILKLAQETFGGVHSEGGLDFAIPFLDRAMYIEENVETLEKKDYVDRVIPFYEIVYHGILLYGLGHKNVNALKGEKQYLRMIEYGAMPLIYFYGHFVSKKDGNWLGDRDFRYETKEALRKDVAEIKEVYNDLVKDLSHLQTEFIEDHQELTENACKTVYSDGSVVIVNYSNKPFQSKEGLVSPHSYLLLQKR